MANRAAKRCRMNRGLFTSTRGDWRTPALLYTKFVPPCFDVSDRHDGTFDAFTDPWPQPWWCNPPYGRGISQWTARMAGSNGVALLPARTDTAWFHDHIWGHCRVEFIRNRLYFDDATRAPFPSMLCYFGGHGEVNGDTPPRYVAPK